ncbi:TIGR02221 family CRISPR-associated protein [Microcoleus vaginatus]|uniref:TIGR02221 family CRISPR-associated protein n=1 Tax=Microcoleus vaginatus TaxID=119532 RepID=UPI0032ADAF74
MSKTKIITFLGDRGAMQTTYSYNKNCYIGGVFAEALRLFCKYDTMLVCVTEKAKTNTWPVLEALQDPRIQAIDIPTGRTTEEMWETFQTITKYVDEGDGVIFDITHGLRSLPFLVFLFAAYLKAAKKVTIEAIYYGALELGNKNEGIPAPVIDLSEFVSMIDWITATTQFVEIGDGQPLASLLEGAIPSNEELKNYPNTRPLRDQLKQSAKAIEDISLALSLTRPIETMESATKLEEILRQATTSFAERAKPFSLLSEKVVQEYGQFALPNPKDEAALSENLRLQFQMIKWYIDRNQLVQAVTLAREWLVSILALRFEEPMFDEKNGRNFVEAALNNAVEMNKPHPRPPLDSRCNEKFAALSEAGELASVWSKMTELRNDIAHVGMNLKPQAAAKLKKKASSLYPRLKKLGESLLPQK